MRKKPLIIFLLFSTVAIVFTALVGMVIFPGFQEKREMEIKDVNISRIPDGTFYGRSETIMAAAKVVVTVEDGQVTGINLVEHAHSNGEVAELVLDRVIEEQCLQVDVVSGATYSSLVLLKAVEDALIYQKVE